MPSMMLQRSQSSGTRTVKAGIDCFRDRPVSFGPPRVPKNIFVVMTMSVRRRPRSRIAFPLTGCSDTLSRTRGRMDVQCDLRLAFVIALGSIEPIQREHTHFKAQITLHVDTVLKGDLDDVLKNVYQTSTICGTRTHGRQYTLTESPVTVSPMVNPVVDHLHWQARSLSQRETHRFRGRITVREVHLNPVCERASPWYRTRVPLFLDADGIDP